MDEFSLIHRIVSRLGHVARDTWISVGPGDDAAVVAVTQGCELVSSIDSLIADTHFPASAPADLIGYRGVMVSVSDIAAMAAEIRFITLALSLEKTEPEWLDGFTDGVVAACDVVGARVVGGNLVRGPLTLTVSVNGEVPTGQAVKRSGAKPGNLIQISGALGGAASCVRQQLFETSGTLSPLQERYFKPRARVDLVHTIRGVADACIDVSDGLVQDLEHILTASEVGASLRSEDIPLFPGAELPDALWGGDDYELLVCASAPLDGFMTIGEVTPGREVLLDGSPLRNFHPGAGYDHFRN